MRIRISWNNYQDNEDATSYSRAKGYLAAFSLFIIMIGGYIGETTVNSILLGVITGIYGSAWLYHFFDKKEKLSLISADISNKLGRDLTYEEHRLLKQKTGNEIVWNIIWILLLLIWIVFGIYFYTKEYKHAKAIKNSVQEMIEQEDYEGAYSYVI